MGNLTQFKVGETYGYGNKARTITKIDRYNIYYKTQTSKEDKVCFETTFYDWVRKQEKNLIKNEINTKNIKNIINYYDNGKTSKTKDCLAGELRISGHRISLSTLVFLLKDMSVEEVIKDYDITREEIDNAIEDVCSILELLQNLDFKESGEIVKQYKRYGISLKEVQEIIADYIYKNTKDNVYVESNDVKPIIKHGFSGVHQTSYLTGFEFESKEDIDIIEFEIEDCDV